MGEGGRLFGQLQQLWSHASVPTKRKLGIYMACVVSKLLYSLESLWLLKADLSRLEAFHCRYLRRILHIPHSYISRISNATVLERADLPTLSSLLHERQKGLYRRISLQPRGSFVKTVICDEAGHPINWSVWRRRGRPRQRWSLEVFKMMDA